MDDLIKVVFTEWVDIIQTSQGIYDEDWFDDNVDDGGWT